MLAEKLLVAETAVEKVPHKHGTYARNLPYAWSVVTQFLVTILLLANFMTAAICCDSCYNGN